MSGHDISWYQEFVMFQVLLKKQNLIICFYNRLQQFGVKSMDTIPLLWPLFLMSRHDILSWPDISEDSQSGHRSKGEPSIHFMIQWTHGICVGETIRSKEPPWVSCPDISDGDIPWNRRGKGLGAWPLSLKIILGQILLGFILKIDASKA